MLFHFVGAPYQDRFYEVNKAEDGTWDRTEWTEHKHAVLLGPHPELLCYVCML